MCFWPGSFHPYLTYREVVSYHCCPACSRSQELLVQCKCQQAHPNVIALDDPNSSHLHNTRPNEDWNQTCNKYILNILAIKIN